MFGWFKSAVQPRPLTEVLSDFDHYVSERHVRCGVCNEMQEAGTTMLWVGDGSTWFKDESYESTVLSARSSNRTASCVPCIRSRR